MSKLAKFLQSALNNSNANEAAQALKLAAATMQSEGVNPSDYLEQKGQNTHQAELLILREQHALAVRSHQAAQNRLRQLEAENVELRRTGESGMQYAAELREAKEQAIKWYKRSESNETQLKELAPIAVAAQEKVSHLQKELARHKGTPVSKLGWFLGVSIAAGVITHFATKSDVYAEGYKAGKLDGESQARQEVKTARPTDRVNLTGLWIPENGIYDIEASCLGKKGPYKTSFKIFMLDNNAKETSRVISEKFALAMPSEGAVPVGYKFTLILMKSGEKQSCIVKKVW